MRNKNFVGLFSIAEMLLLFIASILSSKIADLVEINSTILWVSTFIIVFTLALITFFKTRSVKSIKSTPHINFRITKNVIKQITLAMLYIPSALLFSRGSFQLAKTIDPDWIGILPGISVSVTILFAPLLFDNAKTQGLQTWPYVSGFLLSLIYGGVGYYLILYPDTYQAYLFGYIFISALTMVVLKYVYLYYIFITTFDTWYKQLPDN